MCVQEGAGGPASGGTQLGMCIAYGRDPKVCLCAHEAIFSILGLDAGVWGLCTCRANFSILGLDASPETDETLEIRPKIRPVAGLPVRRRGQGDCQQPVCIIGRIGLCSAG